MREYNLSKEERAEISTKMTELLELCQIHHCPMFATVAWLYQTALQRQNMKT